MSKTFWEPFWITCIHCNVLLMVKLNKYCFFCSVGVLIWVMSGGFPLKPLKWPRDRQNKNKSIFVFTWYIYLSNHLFYQKLFIKWAEILPDRLQLKFAISFCFFPFQLVLYQRYGWWCDCNDDNSFLYTLPRALGFQEDATRG